jgi:hypothetical protein
VDSRRSSRFRLALLFCAVGALFLMLAGQASATHVQCGDTITQDTRLDSGLIDCPGYGIIVGADGITLDLKGHRVDLRPPAGRFDRPDVAVWVDDHDGVTVTNGTLTGGSPTLLVSGDDNVVSGLSVRGAAMRVSGYRNVIRNNLVSSSSANGGILVAGGPVWPPPPEQRGNIVHGNVLYGGDTGVGIGVGEPLSKVFGNKTYGFADGLHVSWFAGSTLVSENVVARARRHGVVVEGTASVRDNTVRQSREDGVVVDLLGFDTGDEGCGTASVIQGNRTRNNGDDGVDVDCVGATVTQNKATKNGDLGIEAVEGTIDGGGNRAFGNGNPLQCLNVRCK